MQIKEQELMVFKSDKGTYKVGLSRKDRNGNYIKSYFPCQFKKGVELENKTKIKANGFISFFTTNETTIFYLMVLDFEKVERQNYAELKGEEIDDEKLPF